MKKKSRIKNCVHIQSGVWCNRKIYFHAKQIRPTGSRVRTTVFDWLRLNLKNSTCLDLFAGSGIMSLEALSNGAAAVYAVDMDSNITDQLKLYKKELSANLNIFCQDAMAFCKNCIHDKFDIVFLDPPFHDVDINAILISKEFQKILKRNALIYFETASVADLMPGACYEFLKDKKNKEVRYGLLKFKA